MLRISAVTALTLMVLATASADPIRSNSRNTKPALIAEAETALRASSSGLLEIDQNRYWLLSAQARVAINASVPEVNRLVLAEGYRLNRDLSLTSPSGISPWAARASDSGQNFVRLHWYGYSVGVDNSNTKRLKSILGNPWSLSLSAIVTIVKFTPLGASLLAYRLLLLGQIHAADRDRGIEFVKYHWTPPMTFIVRSQ